ncbi:MAG: DUF1844 domain-containing protein, partial [Armatimonadota bacterium]|nr:DUF1844 domain-containing protein [Armatimonadota bacterium]
DQTQEQPDEQSEGPAEPGDETEAPAEEPQAEPEEETWEEPPPMAEADVFDMLRAAIGLFTQEAWFALGVQARPGASETRTDLRCARIAIDTTRLLVEQLGDEAEVEERREFEQLLTNLRINFVRRQQSSNEKQ